MDFLLFIAENELYIWVILLAILAVSFWAEKSSWGRKIGSTIMVLILGFILGNAGVLPSEAGVYQIIWTVFVPLAIPLLLFQADIRKIAKESGPTLIAFLIGAVGTVLGAVIAFLVIALPQQAPELAGIFAATYIGGGVNFVAVSQSLGVVDSSLLLAATAADNILTILFLFVLAMLPAVRFFAKGYPQGSHENGDAGTDDRKRPNLTEVAWALLGLAIAIGFVKAGQYIQDMFGWGGTAILITTPKTVPTVFVPLAIPLLLFQADIRKIAKESGPTLIAFLIGAVGTVLGAVIAFLVIALPQQAPELAGIFAATYIGGGVNFVAVSQSLGVVDSSLLLAATAADNILTILFLFVLAMLPAVRFFAKGYPQGSHENGDAGTDDRKRPNLTEVA